MRGIFLTPDDLIKLEARPTKQAAWRTYLLIKQCLGKKGRQQLVTLKEYAQHRGISLDEVKQALQ